MILELDCRVKLKHQMKPFTKICIHTQTIPCHVQSYLVFMLIPVKFINARWYNSENSCLFMHVQNKTKWTILFTVYRSNTVYPSIRKTLTGSVFLGFVFVFYTDLQNGWWRFCHYRSKFGIKRGNIAFR